ncbi:hypothetical protein BVH03_05595 [Pseudomonas sp. PA15(2017)]|uniref:hypothetical protein n=1 Tax=Pseudomonas sp. PA15(2017) TaxID=1932111 RepID=UPI0009672438|nr:hypothetical protein [Pseudomonas sp. PA15(2017)]OLU33260.1 hypothetical protein BVH03_05595 [Pseudomonas sp. PA15(2017)]
MTSAIAGNAANHAGLAMTPKSDMQLMKHPYCWIIWTFFELSLVHFFTQPVYFDGRKLEINV